MPTLVSKDLCCGCSACANRCPRNAITMTPDITGFLFPVVDEDKCIQCGLCEKVCPVIESVKPNETSPHSYIAQNKDDSVRFQSTSGGMFTAIAAEVIHQGGVVFGAAFAENYTVRHTFIEDVEDLTKFRGSKYVQSEIGNAYKEAEGFLKQNRKVCFSGTPCQIQGLKKSLNKDYENLITVDVMCRAVPSPKVFQKYLDYQRKKFPEFNQVVFRDKTKGYSYSNLALFADNKCLYRGGSEYDQWLRLFFKGYCNRVNCHECKFQSGARISDFTLWDCWNTQDYSHKLDDNKGTTNVIAWTNKAQNLLNAIKSSLELVEYPFEKTQKVLNRKPLPKANYDREQFFRDVENMESAAFIQKYVPNTPKIYVKKMIRVFLHISHLHNAVRKTVHSIRKLRAK